jgi:hypothetical protein
MPSFATERRRDPTYGTVTQNTIDNSGGAIPKPTDAPSDPIYFVITQPGVVYYTTKSDGTLNIANSGASFNQPGSYTDPSTGISTNIHMAFLSTVLDGGKIQADDITPVFGHELVEGMSYDDSGNQYIQVVLPSTAPSNFDAGVQIDDNEAGFYRYRVGGPGGVLVSPFFSNEDHSDFAVSDGNVQQLILDADQWHVSGTTANFDPRKGDKYDLTIQGDQFGNGTNDVLTINTVNVPNPGLEMTLNGETFFFDAQYTPIKNIVVNLGDGNDQVNIDGLNGQNVSIQLGSGTVNVGDAVANLSLIQGTVSVQGGSGSDTLRVNDQNNHVNESWAVTGSSIVRGGSAPINYANVANLVLQGGQGTNTFQLSPTAQNLSELPGTSNSFFFTPSASLTVNGGLGNNNLVLNDQNNADASSWSVSGNNVTRSYTITTKFFLELVSTSINYSNIRNLTINGGQSINPLSPINETFTLSPTTQNMDELPGAGTLFTGNVTVNGGAAAINSLVLDDQNNSANSGWFVTGSSITRQHFLGARHVFFDVATIDYSRMANLTLHGGLGNDTFILSSTAEDLDELPGFTKGLNSSQTTLLVEGGAGANSLILDDQNDPNPSTWSVTGSNVTRQYTHPFGTTVEAFDASINYTNLTNLTLHGGKGGSTFTLSPTVGNLDELPGQGSVVPGTISVDGGGSNSLVLDDENILANTTWTDTGTSVTRTHAAGSRIIFFVDGTIDYNIFASVTINGGNATNHVNVQATTASLNVNGGTGHQTVTIGSLAPNYAGGTLANIKGAVDVFNSSSTGSSTLIIDDSGDTTAHTVNLTANQLSGLSPATISWTASAMADGGLNYLVINGSAAASTYLVTNTPNLYYYTFLQTGTASDLVYVVGTTGALYIYNTGAMDFVYITGNNGTLSSINGSVFVYGSGTTYLYVEDLYDTSRTATLTSSSLTGLSPAPIDWVASPVYNSGGVTLLVLYGSAASNNYDVVSVPTFYYGTLIAGGAGSNTLTGPNTTNTWNISGADAGSLNARVNFTGIGNLVGGTGVDTFQFTAVASQVASINGGGAPAGQGNWLDYSAYPAAVTVNLVAGTATGVTGKVSNIQNVFGGNFGNTLFGDAHGTILIGGAGVDQIFGGIGASLLIGGAGNDTVGGGSGEDIIIGGDTTYDQAHNEVALMSILAEWQSGKPYIMRVRDLKLGGGINGSNTLALGMTVVDDGGTDTLTGGSHFPGGLDWFFAGLHDTIHNYESGEQIN